VLSDSHRQQGRPLQMQMTVDGYQRYKINSMYAPVHSLVARHFLGDRPAGMVTNHKDGNKLNNDPDNLEYVTPKENIHHSIKMGFHVASDPTRMPTYKDGRCMKDRKAYKRQWYERNRIRVNQQNLARYHAKKKEQLCLV